MTFRIAVLLEVETNDPRLSEEALTAQPTVQTVARARHAVLQHLPKDIRRVVAIMPVEHAQQLCLLHEAFGREIMGEEIARRVPEFIPPTQE
jgi:hypothetical protein